ncbi:MAG: methyltransferase [Deltaproteobacteria bacterium]|nr:methyltransferase [Deltaproteobacteria bacterium]
MRVISGTLKGRKLASFRGRHIRPTADRVREAVFNILNLPWEAKDVLDLFAGTGGLGIEDSALHLLSRSAIMRGGAVIVAEHHIREQLSNSYGLIALSDRRRYGETAISFYSA